MIKYYGDKTRWFVGDVIDGTPPYGYEGRVRVRIHGVHNPSARQIAQNDLPWAQVVLPTTEGGVSGLGTTPRIEAGALVFGFFMDGNQSQVPLILGSIPRTEYPSPVQKSVAYQDLTERTDPNVEFYNISKSGINEKDPSLGNELSNQPITEVMAKYRRDIAVRFFLSNGYTIKQSCAIVGIIAETNPTFNTTYENAGGIGLMGWSDIRLTRLKQFSTSWMYFSVQLAFIMFELNTTKVDANVRILNSDVIDKSKGKSLGEILSRFYAPIVNDYSSQVKRVYEIYANKV